MMNHIDCEIIQDLLPSYIDGLTCEKTNAVIEEHLAGCEKCRKVLATMKGASTEIPEISHEEKREIDFLKKNKKRNRRILMGSVLGALLFVFIMIAVRTFIVGAESSHEWAAMNLTVTNNVLNFTAEPTGSSNAVAALTYTEENGIVRISARTVMVSPLHRGSLEGNFTASEPIKEVRIGGRIIWANGATVTPLASDLYNTRHSYIGDMPVNTRTANALNMSTYLGPYTNELYTASEPYGWKIILSEEIPDNIRLQKINDMEAFGYIFIGLIENLDHVTFEFQSGGVEESFTVDAESASEFLGQDIKNCSTNIRTLDELISKTGLSLDA
ncbi:MAG: DUF4825 domain-containing protein [Lachnospiraceae bacterium]|nr:DUF4825 domain-containing protein [Lachnospiraceae bacterium]